MDDLRTALDRRAALRGLLASSLLLLVAACAAPPPFQREAPPPATPPRLPDTSGEAIARAAQSLIGSPYRYGGAAPDAFDCSGLVTYVHRQLGLSTPRTAAQQYASAKPIPRGALQPGDLVFFRLNGAAVTHVGVYMGNGRFVHAPQSGGHVREARLDEEYFRDRYAGGGRFHASGGHAVPAAAN